MVTTKRCAWGTCSNDSRFPHLLKKNTNGDEVFFLHFPGSKYHGEKRRRWIQACHRGDGFVCNKYSYICSLHFVGETGPTAEYPDPTSAVLSTEHVSLYFIHDSLICEVLNGYYVNTCSFTYCVKICVRGAVFLYSFMLNVSFCHFHRLRN